jgi:hypothetical protein
MFSLFIKNAKQSIRTFYENCAIKFRWILFSSLFFLKTNLVRKNVGESLIIRIILKIKISTILISFRIILNLVFLILLTSQERMKRNKEYKLRN